MVETLSQIARNAGKLVTSGLLSAKVHEKGRADFVTDADLAVSDYLKQVLPSAFSGSRVLSEEGEKDERLDGNLFIVDPIDGTTNLMYGLNLSVISIAYAVDGDVKTAVCYNPFTDELYAAELGKGATLNGYPIHVNGDASLSEALIAFEAGPATLDTQEGFLQNMIRMHRTSRSMRFTGSAALDLCYTACGRFSAAVFHYLYPWDYAAGWLILSEAGGKLTLINGEMPTLRGISKPIIASNGIIHSALMDAMESD